MRILIIEDDARTAAYLLRGLTESGHIADAIGNGETGLAMALEGIYDALIVDRKLPGLDGIAMVQRFRAVDKHTPVLMLSALASTDHRVKGLAAGCDAYLPKPYAFVEVLARLEALFRRVESSGSANRVLRIGELMLDCTTRRVSRAGKTIQLQQREALLLEKLMRHPGAVVTRDMLLESAWDYDFDPHDNVIDKHIHRLRRKLDEGFEHSLIHTVPGAGYRLN